jgi:thioester reductase-like protein
LPKPDLNDIGIKRVTVCLTGATGSLGAQILARLVSLPNVSFVICLNRFHKKSSTSDAHNRQQISCRNRGVYISDTDWAKMKVYETDCTCVMLGLSSQEYEAFQRPVTHAIHSSWPMNFLRRLASFRDQFQNLRNLLSMAATHKEFCPSTKVRSIFVFSITVVGQYKDIHKSPMVPEIPMSDKRSTRSIGYGQAKLACEKIIEDAAKYHGE